MGADKGLFKWRVDGRTEDDMSLLEAGGRSTPTDWSRQKEALRSGQMVGPRAGVCILFCLAREKSRGALRDGKRILVCVAVMVYLGSL